MNESAAQDRGIPSVTGSNKFKKNMMLATIVIGASVLIVAMAAKKDNEADTQKTVEEHYGTGVVPLPAKHSTKTQTLAKDYAIGTNTHIGGGRGNHNQIVKRGESSDYSINNVVREQHRSSTNNLSKQGASSQSSNLLLDAEQEARWKRRQANPLVYEYGANESAHSGNQPDTRIDSQLDSQLERELAMLANMGTGFDPDALAQAMAQGGQGSRSINPNNAFAQQTNSQIVETATAMPLGNLEHKIIQGKIISGTLETAIDSSLPGMVRAIASNNIYGESGREVLIPKGSRLIGQYNSAIQNGQYRIFIVWSRLIRPDGIDINIGSAGTDPLGRAGSVGDVDSRFWTRFGNATLLSLLGAGTAIYGNDANQLSATNLYRQSISNSFANQATADLANNINIPDTIHLDQGSKIKIMVAKDLDFSFVMQSRYSTSSR